MVACLNIFTQRQCEVLREARVNGVELGPVANFASPPVTETKVRRLRAMAGSADPRVRESAALNAHAPLDVLQTLAKDVETSVRCCVARSPQATSGLLTELAGDPVPAVRAWVAAHRATPAATLSQLIEDPDRSVHDVAVWNLRWSSFDATR